MTSTGSIDSLEIREDPIVAESNASTSSFEHVAHSRGCIGSISTFLERMSGGSASSAPGGNKGKQPLRGEADAAPKPATLSTFGRLVAKATHRYERIDAQHTEAVLALDREGTTTADFERAYKLADKLQPLKPEYDGMHRGSIFEKAMRSRQFDLMLGWMRRIDSKDTHMRFLSNVSFGLKHLDHDPAVRKFIDEVTRFYLEDLPAEVLKLPQMVDMKAQADQQPLKTYKDFGFLLPKSALTPNELYELMAGFADMAQDAGKAHAQYFFDKLPLNLYEAMDVMPRETASRLFDHLDTIRTRLKLNTESELPGVSHPRADPLTPQERRVVCMIRTGAELLKLRETSHGVRMGAQIGYWAMQGRAYEEAAFRIADGDVPRDNDIQRSIDNKTKRPRPVDLSGLGIDSLPPGIETLTWITELDLSKNNFERVPMELCSMRYFSSPRYRIEIDLSDNPLSKMTLEELRRIEGLATSRSAPLIKLPPVIELNDGTAFHSSQALVPKRAT